MMRARVFPPTAPPYDIWVTPEEGALADAVELHLVRPNVAWLAAELLAGREVPRYGMLARTQALIYARDPDEEWLTIPHVIARGECDCEDASAFKDAEDRVREGWYTVPTVKKTAGPFHVQSLRPKRIARPGEVAIAWFKNGVLLDGAREIGM